MKRVDELAARDGWFCWLCEGELDPDTPPGSPASTTIDHVVPKSRGGRTEFANLRLAHRRCNTDRGNDLPELEWPDRFMTIDAAPLWQSLARILRRRRPEIIAVTPTHELGEAAGAWACERIQRFVGGEWSIELEPVGHETDSCLVRLTLVGEPDIADVGRPTAGRRPRRR